MLAKQNLTKKLAEIKVVESEEIVQHIVPATGLYEKKQRRSGANGSKSLTYTATFSGSKSVQDLVGDDSSDEDVDTLAPLGTDTHEADEVEQLQGKAVFQFRTPKKSGQMALKAIDSFSPSATGKSPHRSASSPLVLGKSHRSNLSPAVAKTPPRTKSLARKSLESSPATPQKPHGVAAVREHKRMESSTPYRLRKRHVAEPEDSSSEDDSVDESSEEDGDEREEEEEENRLAGMTSKSEGMNTAESAEVYFDLHAQAPVTSDRTLASLEGPRLDVDTVRSVLGKLTPGHSRHCRALVDKHARLFDQWMLHMCCGFNILVHGLGSKRDLLEKFREQHLGKFSHLVVNGYFPSLTVKHILNSITEDILESPKGFTNAQAQVEFIKQQYKNRDEDFYLVIHNIDGLLLRSEKCQATLSLLAETEGFHIIASLDHINAGFMWDQTKYFRFRWLWYETTTFAPYEAENWYENSLLVQQSGGLALSSLAHVMRSLTPNARQIFLLLAEYQMENADNANYQGMSFQALYHKCREAFLVNSDLTLQAQLVEFKDHRLLKARKNFEGIEHLSIPIDQGTLKEFLQDYKNNF